MADFEKVAPYLSDPLILIGFFVFVFFGFCRYLLKRGIIPQLNKAQGYRILRSVLLYGFLFGLAIIGLGFGLKYRSLSAEEQRRAIALVTAELDENSKLVGSLAANLETLVNAHATIAKALRDQRFPILSTSFPESNLRESFSSPTPSELAVEALLKIRGKGLARDAAALRKTDAVGRVIVGMVDRTLPTLNSLADKSRQRYVFRRTAYEGNAQVMRRIEYVDVTKLPALYADLDKVRANYEIVVANLIAYQEAVRDFFRGEELNEATLTAVLTAERLSTSVLMSFTPELVGAGEALRAQMKELARD